MQRQVIQRQKKRQGWKAFLTPGWVITAVLVFTFTYFAVTFLGPWQLHKGEEKAAFNHRLEEALTKDPVPLSQVVPADGSSTGIDKEWTHVRLQGKFILDAEVLLRNRPVDSNPAFQVLTPFKTVDNQTILVNRGWIPPVNGADVPEIPNPPAGDVDVTGYIRMSEARPNTPPTQSQGFTQVSGMNTAQIGETKQDALRKADGLSSAQTTPLASEYIQLDEASVAAMNEQDASDAELSAISLPQLDNGPHMSYAFQWWTFGLMAPAALLWFAWSEIRERRREKQEIAEAEAMVAAQRRSGAGAGSGAGDGADSSAVHASSTGGAATTGASANTADIEAVVEDLSAPRNEPGALAEDGAAVVPAEKTAQKRDTREEIAARKLADRYGGTRNRFEERRAAKRGERF